MKEIDWEQRRYEIARDVLAGMYSNSEEQFTPKEFKGHLDDWAIAIADSLIEKLKKQPTNEPTI